MVSISSNERPEVCVLDVLDLEVVSLTLKLPEVWGNTSKAAKERRKERRWLKSGGGSAVAKERRWPVDQLVLMNAYERL